METVPGDGSRDVPRNIELRISYYHVPASPAQGTPVLETETGERIATTWEHTARDFSPSAGVSGGLTEDWIGHAAAPLAASTRYRLRHPFRACASARAGIEGSCLCDDQAGEPIAEFTTGASVLEASLALPVLSEPAPMGLDIATSSAACGPYARCLFRVVVSALASGELLRVYRGEAWLGDFTDDLLVGVHRDGSNGFPYGTSINQRGAAEYTLFRVDAAGHRSSPKTLRVPACANDANDQDASTKPETTTPRPDAGLDEQDAAPSSDASDEGCSLRASGSGGTPAWWSVLGALALLVRRRSARSTQARC